MEKRSRKRGSVTEIRGKLGLRFWWRHPEDAHAEYRWSVSTHYAANDVNRELLEKRLEIINAKIAAGAFFPCSEFPDSKIAAYCQCPACAVLEPLSRAHVAPVTLGDLFVFYTLHEADRASGKGKIIEASTWRTKKQGMRALEGSFSWRDAKGELFDFAPLTDYHIRELTPHNVKYWLLAFQNRQELLTKDKPPASTSYLRNLHSIVHQAVEYGQLQRWWRTHPLLEYNGVLIEATKEERNRQRNKSLFKPFTIVERDKVIAWFEKQWRDCPEKEYNGKEKLRRFFLYHYVVIGFNTGLRSPSEMTALEWRNVDYGRKRLSVVGSREASGRVDEQVIRRYTKTIKHREVPINDAALASFKALEEYRQDQDWVFWNPRASKDNPLANEIGWAPLTGEKRVRYQFEKCLKALKIDSPRHQGQYRMRHTFVTTALDNTTLSDAKIAAMIGDGVDTMKAHYAGHCLNRWRDEDDIDQLNALNAAGKGRLRSVK